MSATLQTLHASAPAIERGRPTILSTDAKNERLIYGNGNIVYIRNLNNPIQCDVYTQHSAAVTAAKFSPSGFYVASGDAAGNVRIWATDNVDQTLKLEIRPISGPVLDIAWSPDNQRIAVVGDGKERYAHVFIWDSGSQVGEISGHSKAINSVAYRPIRPFRIATASEDFQVNFFQGPPFKFMHSNKNHTRFANCVRYSPNGLKFCSVGSDAKGYIYDGATGQLIIELSAEGAHTASIYSCSWSPDSTRIVTASADKTVKLWDAETGALIKTFTFADRTLDFSQQSVVWAGDHIVSLSYNGNLNYLDIDNPEKPARVVEGHNKSITSIAFDKANNTIYTASYDAVVIAWELDGADKGRIRGKGHSNSVQAMTISNGKLVTVGVDDALKLTPVSTLEYPSTSVEVFGTPADVSAAKDGSDLIAVVTARKLIMLRGETVVTSIDISYTGSTVDISNDSREIAVGGQDKKVRIYSFESDTLTEIAALEGHRGAITKVRYSPDGQSIAVGDANREVIVWDKETRQQKITGLVFHTARVLSVAFSDDSRYLVTGALDTNIIVTDLHNTQKRVIIKNAHMQGVSGVVFVGENRVASVGNDCCLKIWNINL